MGRSRLRIKFMQNLASKNWHKYTRLRNKFANLLKKIRNITLLKII